MKTLKLIAAVAFTLAAVACAKEQAAPQEAIDSEETQANVPEGYVRLTFTTPAGTKTSLDKESGVVSWAEHDRINICWEGGNAISDEVVISGGVARFTANVSAAADDLYAVYPSSITASVAEGTLSVDIPQSQTGRFEDADIIVAKTTKTDLSYAFHHAVSLVRFVISDGNAKGITRAKFVDLANNSQLYGTLGITFDGENAISANALTEDTTKDVIDITAVAEGDNWIAVPAEKSLQGYGLRMGTSSEWLPGIVGEKPYTFDAAGKRLALGTVDAKINEGDWYIKADGTGDGKTWATAGGPALLQSLMGDYASKTNTKNLARVWRVTGKTIKVAEGNYISTGGTNGFTSRNAGGDKLVLTIEGGYTTEGVKSNSAETVFGPSADTDPFRALFFAGAETDVTLKDLVVSDHLRVDNAGGAAIYVTQGAALTVIGCTFEGNATNNGRGGGAVLVGDSPVRFEDCVFNNNSTNLVGGAVMTDTGSAVVFDGCSFDNNSATENNKANGGALYLKDAATIKDCTFTGNWVINATEKKNTHGNGGAVYSLSDITISGSVFNGNYASDGGAIYLEQTGSLTAVRCKFIGNYTNGKRWYSGSTFNGREGSGVVAFEDTGSTAYDEGNNAYAYFNSCEFRGNYAPDLLYCSNITYAWAQATTLGYNNCVFYENSKEGTAGWDIYSRGEVIMINSTMIDNCANAVYYVTGAGSYLYNSIVIGTGTGVRGSDALVTHDYNIINSYNGLTQAGNEVTASSLGFGSPVSYDTFSAGIAAGVTTGMSYYSWDGADLAFTKTSKTAIVEKIGATDFYAWLNGLGALDVDIRGNMRNASAVWPGSYEN